GPLPRQPWLALLRVELRRPLQEAAVGETVDPVRQRDERNGVDDGDRRARQGRPAVQHEHERDEDRAAHQATATKRPPPGRHRRLAQRAARAFRRLARRLLLDALLLSLLAQLCERRLVPLFVEEDGLVLVPERLVAAA